MKSLAEHSSRLPVYVSGELDPRGKVVIGKTTTNGTEDDSFDGLLQQLYLIPSSDAAFDYCFEYLPDCDTPLPWEQPTDDIPGVNVEDGELMSNSTESADSNDPLDSDDDVDVIHTSSSSGTTELPTSADDILDDELSKEEDIGSSNEEFDLTDDDQSIFTTMTTTTTTTVVPTTEDSMTTDPIDASVKSDQDRPFGQVDSLGNGVL